MRLSLLPLIHASALVSIPAAHAVSHYLCPSRKLTNGRADYGFPPWSGRPFVPLACPIPSPWSHSAVSGDFLSASFRSPLSGYPIRSAHDQPSPSGIYCPLTRLAVTLVSFPFGGDRVCCPNLRAAKSFKSKSAIRIALRARSLLCYVELSPTSLWRGDRRARLVRPRMMSPQHDAMSVSNFPSPTLDWIVSPSAVRHLFSLRVVALPAASRGLCGRLSLISSPRVIYPQRRFARLSSLPFAFPFCSASCFCSGQFSASLRY